MDNQKQETCFSHIYRQFDKTTHTHTHFQNTIHLPQAFRNEMREEKRKKKKLNLIQICFILNVHF